MSTKEPLLTAKEIAGIFRVTRAAPIYWARKLGCPHVKLPGVYRFKESDVREWLEKQPWPKKKAAKATT